MVAAAAAAGAVALAVVEVGEVTGVAEVEVVGLREAAVEA